MPELTKRAILLVRTDGTTLIIENIRFNFFKNNLAKNVKFVFLIEWVDLIFFCLCLNQFWDGKLIKNTYNTYLWYDEFES